MILKTSQILYSIFEDLIEKIEIFFINIVNSENNDIKNKNRRNKTKSKN